MPRFIGPNCSLAGLEIHACDEAYIEIGAGVGVVGRAQIYMPEPSRLIIGPGCLFATETLIMTSDFHSILDQHSGERLNFAMDIEIAPEVWIGTRAIILKGARIGRGSIIGAGAIVTGTVPANCVAAGNPARVVKTGVRWCHELLPSTQLAAE